MADPVSIPWSQINPTTGKAPVPSTPTVETPPAPPVSPPLPAGNTPTSPPPSNPPPTDKTSTDPTLSPYGGLVGAENTITSGKNSLDQANSDLYAMGQNINKTLTSIENGSIPLSTGEQAQISGLKQQFGTLIDQQKLQNTSASGIANVRGYQTGAAEYDPTFQAKTIGSIVTAGLNKVADLNIKMASAVAQLTQSFQDKKFSEVKDIWTQYQQASKDRTDAIQKTITDAQAVIKDYQDKQQKIQDDVNKIAEDAAKNGADAKTIQAITTSGNVTSAIAASGGYLQTASGTLGEYLQYKRDAEQKGLVPLDYQSYKDQQDAKQAKLDTAKAYNNAYATAAGKNAADNANGGGGGYNGTTQKEQVAMEKDFKNTLLKEFSTRSGTYGLNDAKVSQANKLAVLFGQAYDPKTGNYNIAKSQYGELAIGLANLISGGTGASDTQISDLKQATAKGDWNAIYTYVTGSPSNASSQDVFKLLAQSVDREAKQAVADRQVDESKLIGLAPTDLDPARRDALIKAQSISFKGIPGISDPKTNITNFLKTNGNDKVQTSDGEHSLWYITQTLADTPGSTPEDVEAYLKANKWMP